jgi:DNA-binding transcriptional LysR family regulator
MVHHQLCRAGVGVATIPEWEVRDDVKKKHLQRVLSAWTPSPIEVIRALSNPTQHDAETECLALYGRKCAR